MKAMAFCVCCVALPLAILTFVSYILMYTNEVDALEAAGETDTEMAMRVAFWLFFGEFAAGTVLSCYDEWYKKKY